MNEESDIRSRSEAAAAAVVVVVGVQQSRRTTRSSGSSFTSTNPYSNENQINNETSQQPAEEILFDESGARQVGEIEPEFASATRLSAFIPDAARDKHKPPAWTDRRGVVLLTICVTAVLIFLTNLVATALLYKLYSSATIFRGDCNVASNIDIGLHGVINIFSTLLLGASNLSMQYLAAPTRNEVDQAHKDYKWLDIGVPSIRNMRHIARWRRAVWCLLGLSSLPLHFL